MLYYPPSVVDRFCDRLERVEVGGLCELSMAYPPANHQLERRAVSELLRPCACLQRPYSILGRMILYKPFSIKSQHKLKLKKRVAYIRRQRFV